jgi:hypothetical protein
VHVLTLGDLHQAYASLVSWKSKKQSVVSGSSSEAEYRALAQATCEGQWLLYLLEDFQIPHPSPIIIYCDNQSIETKSYFDVFKITNILH